jgi:hypothetical protein
MIENQFITGEEYILIKTVISLLKPLADATDLVQSDRANVFTTIAAVCLVMRHIENNAEKAGVVLGERTTNPDGSLVNWESFFSMWVTEIEDPKDQEISVAFENDEAVETLLERRARRKQAEADMAAAAVAAAASAAAASDAAPEPAALPAAEKPKPSRWGFDVYYEKHGSEFEKKWKALCGGDNVVEKDCTSHFARADLQEKALDILGAKKGRRHVPKHDDWIKVAWSYFHRRFYDNFCTDPVMMALALQPACDYSDLNCDLRATLRHRLMLSGAPLIALWKRVPEGMEKEEVGTAAGAIAVDWANWVKQSPMRIRTLGDKVTLFSYWNEPRNRELTPNLAILFDFLFEMPATEAACER